MPSSLLVASALIMARLPRPADDPGPRPDDATLMALGDSVFALHRTRERDIPRSSATSSGSPSTTSP